MPMDSVSQRKDWVAAPISKEKSPPSASSAATASRFDLLTPEDNTSDPQSEVLILTCDQDAEPRALAEDCPPSAPVTLHSIDTRWSLS